MKKILLLLLFCPLLSQSQNKKTIDHTVYDSWKSVTSQKISHDGNWVTYEINPQKGDGWLYLVNPKQSKIDSLPRGYKASLSPSNKFLAFKIKPQHDSIRKLKLDKVDKKKHPKDSLGIWVFETNEIQKIANVKSYSIPKDEGQWMAYLLEKKTDKKEEGKKKKKKKKNTPPESDGTELWLFNPITGEKFSFNNVIDYVIAENGSKISFVTQIKTKEKVEIAEVFIFDTEKKTHLKVYGDIVTASQLTFDELGNQFAFIISKDTTKEKSYSLAYLKSNEASANIIVDSLTSTMPEGWCPSKNGKYFFSKNASKLYLNTAKIPRKESKDTLLEEEKYKVDIWHWKDQRLQPHQLVQLDKDKKKSYLAVYHLEQKKFVQLADEDVDHVELKQKGNATVALGRSTKDVNKYMSWDYPWYRDYYLVNINTGEKKLIKEKVQHNFYLSNTGKYLLWFDGSDSSWYSKPTAGGNVVSLTKNLNAIFYDDNNGEPYIPYGEGIAGWTKDDSSALIYSRYDVWEVDPTGKNKARNWTNGVDKKVKYRYMKLDSEEEYINKWWYKRHFHGFNEVTKKSGYYRYYLKVELQKIRSLYGPYKYSSKVIKAKNNEAVLYTKQTFSQYPDVWYTKKFSPSVNADEINKKISNTNPQTKDYLWGSVELVKWKAYDSTQLEGLLYKPENFDPNKKYPMLVYFYEINSHNLYEYWTPKPSRSIIGFTEYTSNGYIVFVPDIRYKEGHPGKSAYNCIVSGTEHLVNKHSYIDKDKLGLQGQSWGGYQTAYLVTQTNMYAAAMAGAPVSNMFSAYGGIRWGSGMSRMFQYERTQSRIGATIWEKPELYVENSPLFHVQSIKTPLLMMHNDKDGAVPWYQGIEMFVAMRRLNKPAWMLNYNGEEHNLTKRGNQTDLSIRMKQFFDYYLMDKPAPVWIEEGVPAIEKGKTSGYDLIEGN